MPAVADDFTPASADPLLAAQAQAVSTGQAVPVGTLTTEVSTTEALPDGTFVNTTSVLPARVLKDGAWIPVDATLVADDHGGYSPKTTPNGVTLSGGGDGPLVTLTHADGPSMALTLPFTLPTPTVSGNTALYPSVLPGVDLSASVTDQGGFSDVLIVHDSDAAANPELKKLTLAASTDGLTLSTTDSDSMTATAADGDLAYMSPQPLMWDSGPAPVESGTPSGPTADPASSVDGPGPGADTAPVAMIATSNALTLTPDAGMLTGPDTTYPVYIDPYTNPVSSTAGHYTEVYSSSTCDNSPQYDKAQTNGQGVGYQRWGGACGVGLERSYWAINTSGLHPAFVVYDAFVKISTTYAASWNCSQNQPLTLHTTNAISSSTDWLSRPGVHDSAFPPVTDTVPSGANSNSSCSNTTATFHVTDQAQKIADQDGDGYDADGTFGAAANVWTMGLYGNESQTSSNDDYLRMSTTLTLTTRFDIPPSVPTSLHISPAATGASAACTTSSVGWIGATTYSDAGSNITLHSTVTTQMSGENVKAHYYVWDRTVDPDGDGNGASVATPDSAFLASGSDAAMKIGATLKDGHQYGWDVYAEDDSTLNLTSAKSEHCWFNTDFTAPQTPEVTDNASFPPLGSGPADPVIYAGPGKTTNFTVAGADNPATDGTCTPGSCKSSGMASFLWQLDSPPTAADGQSAAITGTDSQGRSTATIPVPIRDWGVHTLYVAGVDKAGNISTSPYGYTFTVPWNPATAVKPGDITGDGVPDLLATTKTGDLDLIPGDLDPAQETDPVQSGPVTGTPPAVTGPVTVATAADSPDGTGWNNYLIAHRGNLHGANGDDLFAYNKGSGQLYVVKNDLDPVDDASFPTTPYSTFGGFIGRRYNPVNKETCASSDIITDDARCRSTDYDSHTWNISQLITPGNVFGNTNDYPAVITVENKELWIYQSDGGYHLKNPILLGDGDWTGQTLIAAGTFKGKLVLWSRDNSTGNLYSYPIAVDPTTLLPSLLHPATHTTLPLTLPPALYPVVASPGDINSPVQTGDTNPGGPDGIPDLYTVDTSGQLVEYNYRQSPILTSPPTYDFAPPVSLGSVTDTAAHWWKLAEGTGTASADSTGALNATLSGAYTWTTDTIRGKALNLTGTTGYGSTTGPAVNTSKSFTVSAWVKLNSLSVNGTFVSEDGTTNNGFQLYYSSGSQSWAFGRHSTDTTDAVWRATYGSKAITGQWTHLVGVYDATAKEIRLYVNGKLTATRDWTYTPWNATGPIQIGRKLSSGTYGEYANAAISNVRIYPTALPPADAAATGDTPKTVQLD
ncbi:LamG domain-containing protein [Streptomyces sp. NPDC001635]